MVSRCWNEALHKHLKKIGFTQSKNDPCIYILNLGGEIFIIAVYVDDIIMAGKTCECIQKFINAIAEKFDNTDMGKFHHCVGIKINYLNSRNIWIGQPAHVRKVLKKFKTSGNPCGDWNKISQSKGWRYLGRSRVISISCWESALSINKDKTRYCIGC